LNEQFTTASSLTKGIDHFVIDVRDGIEEAEQTYRLLGFHLSERGHHTLGSVNHLIVFGDHYLELLGFGVEAEQKRPDIANYPVGLNGLVFSANDVKDLYASLLNLEIPAQLPQYFSRPVKTNDGTADAKFEVVRLNPGLTSYARIYFCHHVTPQLVWTPESQHHPNGVFQISRIRIASNNPSHSAALPRIILGEKPNGMDQNAASLQAGEITLDFVSANAVDSGLMAIWPEAHGREEYMATMTFRTVSLEQTFNVLRTNNIAGVSMSPNRILVAASSAVNVGLEFIEG
jgi:hypothetical protein